MHRKPGTPRAAVRVRGSCRPRNECLRPGVTTRLPGLNVLPIVPGVNDTPDVKCPDCGTLNPPDRESCARCNFPLRPARTPEPADAAPQASDVPAGAPPGPPAAAEPPILIEVPERLRRARERRSVKDPSLTLWLFIGTLGAIALLFIAVRGHRENNAPQVEGAQPEQQARAEEIFRAIQEDSTNVAARVAFGDLLYDTGNWNEAIVHYRAAVRMDSTQVEALVDLGVCYYNLGFTDLARTHFEGALARNPQQTIALFNMGILNERAENFEAALGFFHRSLQTQPPEALRPPIVEAIGRVQQKLGREAPPLPEGSIGGN